LKEPSLLRLDHANADYRTANVDKKYHLSYVTAYQQPSPQFSLADRLFTGQRLDETGLYFYNARYYDAVIGRFVSPDTIIPNPANP
jgi:RHS repeat-associated protein